MQHHDSIDETRRKIQQALIESKRERLREDFGLQAMGADSDLPPEVELDFLSYVQEFERQMEANETITVRQRLSDPAVVPLAEVAVDAVEAAVEDWLEALAEHGVAVDFLGEWDAAAAYRYITETLLDEEMDDIRIEGVVCHFVATTPAYDVAFWVDEFVDGLFAGPEEQLVPLWRHCTLHDSAGRPLAPLEVKQRLEAIWAVLPAGARGQVEPTAIEVDDQSASVGALVGWEAEGVAHQVESRFRLAVSPYSGWDVIYTTLLDQLAEALGVE